MSLVNSLIGPVSGLLDKVIEDKDQKAALAHEIATMSEKHANAVQMAQISVNAAEAASGSLFKGGWRPCVGWVCAIAFFYHFVGQPIIIFIVALSGAELPELPSFEMNTLLTVLGGMLGIGSLRSYEKKQGITK